MKTRLICPSFERYKTVSVAAGFQPAGESGILPGGLSLGLRRHFRVPNCHSGRQDAALYRSQVCGRYNYKPTLSTYGTHRPRAGLLTFLNARSVWGRDRRSPKNISRSRLDETETQRLASRNDWGGVVYNINGL